MARNIQIIRWPNGQSVIQISSGAQFTSITALCNDRALHKLSHIMVHRIAMLPDRPLKLERPTDMMVALIAARIGPFSCGPNTDGPVVVDCFYHLIENHPLIDDLIHSQLIDRAISAFSRRFIRWYGASLQARGVALED